MVSLKLVRDWDLDVYAAAAASVVAGAALLAVAVDVHVNELFPVAVQVNDAGGSIFAVPERLSADD